MVTARRFSLPGLERHALVEGDPKAPPLVLLHGFPESSEAFRALLPDLAAAGFFVVAPDLRGYGKSERPSTGYDLDTLAQDVAHMIRALGGGACLLGQDWGGVIAYHVAARHPAEVRRLLCVNAPHPVVMARRMFSYRQVWRSWYAAVFQLPWLPEWVLSLKGGWVVSRLIRAMVEGPIEGDLAALDRFAEDFAQPGAAHAAVAYYREVMGWFFGPGRSKRLSEYPTISAPFRLVWGERDQALSLLLTERLEPYFSGGFDLQRLEGVGHFVWLERPKRLVEHALAHFLATGLR